MPTFSSVSAPIKKDPNLPLAKDNLNALGKGLVIIGAITGGYFGGKYLYKRIKK